MPELPEVQTTVNGIKRRVVGLSIRDVWTDYKSSFYKGKDDIKNPSYFTFFAKTISNTKITDASRRGKNVLIHLSNGFTILVHMKMTGHLMYGHYKKETEKTKTIWKALHAGPLRDDPFNRHIHLVFSLSDGKNLVLSDLRKFAKITLVKTDDIETSPHIKFHGPEPLDKNFTKEVLEKALKKKPNRPIKIALMDHETVSGIGNIYSDEILWRVGIHPLEKVKNIPNKLWPKMFTVTRKLLRKGISFGGDSMSDYRDIDGKAGTFQEAHKAYRKTGKPCSRKGCKGIITRIKIGGRSAHFCNKHQKLIS